MIESVILLIIPELNLNKNFDENYKKHKNPSPQNDPLTTTKSINKALNRHKLFSKIDKLYKKHFQNSETNLSDYKYYEAKNLAAGKVSYQIKDHFKKQLIKGPLCLMDRRSSREIEEENLRYKSFMV